MATDNKTNNDDGVTNIAGRPRTPARPDAKASGLASKEESFNIYSNNIKPNEFKF